MGHPIRDIDQLTVLLVEDNVESLNLVRSMLKDFGLSRVYAAKNGLEALDFMTASDGHDTVDVVLCDWNMPKCSGLELLKQIRTRDPDLPFVMITGNVGMESVAEANSFGVTGYIRKPFSASQLRQKLNLVSRIVCHRRKQQEVSE